MNRPAIAIAGNSRRSASFLLSRKKKFEEYKFFEFSEFTIREQSISDENVFEEGANFC